jgi:hypothetical protein
VEEGGVGAAEARRGRKTAKRADERREPKIHLITMSILYMSFGGMGMEFGEWFYDEKTGVCV